MLPDESINGWHSTDDEVPVPVRTSAPAPKKEVPITQINESPVQHVAPPHVTLKHAVVEAPDPKSMRLAAALGMSIVLGAAAFYFGVGSLRGDLTGTDSTTTVTITAEGTFSPATLTVHPGDTVTIENKNADPQVLKPKNNRTLFPVQVIFQDPYTFSVAADAVGPYIYISETLPEELTLTFNVEAGAVATSSSVASTDSDFDIPLPFAEQTLPVAKPTASSSSSVAVAIQTSSSSSSSSVSSAPAATVHSGETATIDLGGAKSSSSQAAMGGGNIPTNPYTVKDGLAKQQQNLIAKQTKQETLHSGAPLLQKKTHTPKRVTETGPEGALLLLIPALLGVTFVYRKIAVA